MNERILLLIQTLFVILWAAVMLGLAWLS